MFATDRGARGPWPHVHVDYEGVVGGRVTRLHGSSVADAPSQRALRRYPRHDAPG
jgi:hypothetical protein